MVIKEDKFQWFTRFLIKNIVEVVLLPSQIINLQMNFIGRLLDDLRDEKFIHLLETIFGVLIWLIYNHQANATKELDIYWAQLICLVNIHALFL